MTRLPTRGSTVASPSREGAALHASLVGLGVGDFFDEGSCHELYLRLARIVGRWTAEEERLESSSIVNALISTGKHLDEIARMLAGHETGLQCSGDMEMVSQLAEYMALDPTVGSIVRAKQLFASFRHDAARIAHTSLVAAADLSSRPGERGRPRLGWYDDFTELLLKIARKAAVEPSSRKDRKTRERSGWLFDAALALETFLHPHMRSPSAEACGQRLDRSRRRLRQRTRQKRTTR
jgi:hypothetical protein